MSIYISIGNSDDKLGQALWSAFHHRTNLLVREFSTTVHGHWLSEPSAPWQNACWCVEVREDHQPELRDALRLIAGLYGQESIAWTEGTAEFLEAYK